jgi:hypothetical protein
VRDGIVVEREVKVSVRGGMHVWCHIYKPGKEEGKLAPLIA